MAAWGLADSGVVGTGAFGPDDSLGVVCGVVVRQWMIGILAWGLGRGMAIGVGTRRTELPVDGAPGHVHDLGAHRVGERVGVVLDGF